MKYENTLILFRKQNEYEFKDITDKVNFIDIDNNSYFIIFSNDTSIHAQLKNVKILKFCEELNLENKIVVFKNIIKKDIIKIEVFEDANKYCQYKVYCKNGYRFICFPDDIEFYNFTEHDKNLIGYWASCACESELDTVASMMCCQYDSLEVNPSSVLYSYINKQNGKNKIKSNIICPFSFNNSQLKAINSALQNKISIIKGPPGTGKTQTILNIISNLIIQGKSIAVISANNTAIENIENKLKNNGYETLYASLGNGDRKAEFFKKLTENNLVHDTDRTKVPLEKLKFLSRLFESENKSKILKEEIEAIKLEQQYYKKFNHESLVDVNKYKFKNSQSLINYVTKYQEDTKERKFTFFLWLKLILKYGFKKSLIKVKDRDKILTSLEYKYYTLKSNELSKELEILQHSLKDAKLDDLKAEYNDLSKKQLNFYINTYMDFDINFTQKDYKKRFSEFIKRYPIITSTAISFMSSIESEYMFDYVIIDESSQVTIPLTIPLLNKCKNIVIVGDDKQLPPIENFNTECQFDEIFDSNKQSLITSFMKMFPDTITTLLEHYRCNPSIIGFCNLKYYNNELIPFTNEDKEKESLSIYFTSDGNHMRKIYDGDENGTYNQREIDTIDEILVNEELKNINHEEIGIISPYRLQVKKLQEKYLDIECDTIHKFQGREKNTVIFSAVLDGKASKNDFSFVDDSKMINVTVSRAINKFILIANGNVFNEKGKEIHDLINYISYKSMNENLFKSKCISIFDYLYKSKEEERNKILEKSSSKSNYASEKLLRVLLDEIIKLEPYNQFTIQEQVRIKDFTINNKNFSESEKTYIRNNCSVDFLVKDKVNHDIVCIIEVDGVAYHENNKEQQIKDSLKDSILQKCNLPLLRLKTNGSNEEIKIKQIFNNYLDKFQP